MTVFVVRFYVRAPNTMPHWTNLVKSSLSKGEILPVRIGGGVPNMYQVKKINKRLVIVKDNVVVYTMPNWLRITSKKDLEELAVKFNQSNKRCIDSIVQFETKFSPRSSVD